MAHVAMTMNALAVPDMEEECAGCFRKFRRAERMNAMEYADGAAAGWHCDQCVKTWQTGGEQKLPRWAAEQEKQP